MRIKITKKTFTALDLSRLHPRAPGHWNVETLDQYHLIDVDDEVAAELERRGASLDDPMSIEAVVLEAVKGGS